MRRKMMWVTLLGAAFTLTGLYSEKQILATPASGFTGTTIALGKFGKIEAFNQAILQDPSQAEGKALWLSLQKTQGVSDLYVQSNVWKSVSNNNNVVASTGWHTHPGHSLIIVTAGTVSVYEGDDRACRPHVYSAGMGFVDEGGDHVHNIRNESTFEEARTVAVQLIAARLDGSSSAPDRRKDAPDPGNCSF